MSGRARSAGRFTLHPEAFARLLRMLDPDRERAGEQYERLRQKLIAMFRWRGATAAEDLADETMDRVAKRLAEGETLRVANPYLYVHGVAVNVLREHWRDPGRVHEPLLTEPIVPADSADPEQARETAAAMAREEQRLECLTSCIDALSPESRHLLVAYHRDEGRGRIEGRQLLAETLGIPMNALRIRVFRIRAGVARCTARCVDRKQVDRKSIGADRTTSLES